MMTPIQPTVPLVRRILSVPSQTCSARCSPRSFTRWSDFAPLSASSLAPARRPRLGSAHEAAPVERGGHRVSVARRGQDYRVCATCRVLGAPGIPLLPLDDRWRPWLGARGGPAMSSALRESLVANGQCWEVTIGAASWWVAEDWRRMPSVSRGHGGDTVGMRTKQADRLAVPMAGWMLGVNLIV
jgi:hypothetical protein